MAQRPKLRQFVRQSGYAGFFWGFFLSAAISVYETLPSGLAMLFRRMATIHVNTNTVYSVKYGYGFAALCFLVLYITEYLWIHMIYKTTIFRVVSLVLRQCCDWSIANEIIPIVRCRNSAVQYKTIFHTAGKRHALALLQHCRDPCQISEWCYYYNTQSRGFEASWDLAIRSLTA